MKLYKPTGTGLKFSEEEIQIINKASAIFENVLETMRNENYYHFYYGDTIMTVDDLANFTDNFDELLSGKDIYLDD